MLEPVLFFAKILFLVLLYFFIIRMVRGLAKDLSRGAEPISMPARPAAAAPPVSPLANRNAAGPTPRVATVVPPAAPVATTPAAVPAPSRTGEKKGREPVAAKPEADSSTREFDYLYNKLQPRLVVQHSKLVEDGKVFEIKGGVTIGRSPASQISLPDDYVSSTHARIFARKQFFFIEDLGSTNGTFIDGRRVEGEHQIKPGQEIVIGDTIFRYEE
ncbi:MAG: FHA domain-containing protein [Thermoleophilia bacterium]